MPDFRRPTSLLTALFAAAALGQGTPATTPPTTAPRAILFRLVENTAAVVGTLDGPATARRWTPGESLGPLAHQQIGTTVKATVLGPTGKLGTATVGGRIETNDPCDWVRETRYLTTVKTVFPAHALSAPWNPVPRIITALPLNSAPYLAIVSAELKKWGLTATPRLVQLLRTDLDGNGRDDILMVAASDPVTFGEGVMNGGYAERAGQYSLVLVRESLPGGVKTSVLGKRIFKTAPAPGTFPEMLTQRIGAVADLNGDGRMEVLVDDYVHEGEGTTVWQSGAGNRGMAKVLEWGCGV
ncbi:hypothetical protein [Deinococcus sp. QL22]|uniref:hypothetical protein n=1 Tax=Deinococcus sp. QL22 TaxID=2939437 RepID=UPI002016D6A8|nr:hypothetical protein [Deinococcus sp. QL22]UQN07150.1 hypothetical protein M1R55_04355 [Deinococcus sp. QL22]